MIDAQVPTHGADEGRQERREGPPLGSAPKVPEDEAQFTRVQRRLGSMGLSMAETGTGRYLVTDRRCNLAPGFLPLMTLDAIEKQISQTQPGGRSG
jgi:hypothetical protein